MSGLLPGEKQIPEQPRKIEHRKLKNHPDRLRKGLQSRTLLSGNCSVNTSVPSDTAGLSANIQTTGLTSPGAPHIISSNSCTRMRLRFRPNSNLQIPLKISGASSEKFSGKYDHLEIWVSHSAHEFKLFGLSSTGQREVLYHTRVGLGFW